ncbi:hypothetical protein RJ640_005903 [Escallonia rubra]|uniref:Glutathione S-transferase n=1 Tax=Escallonia rubra TaxID=112253 RepID=A0AA88U4V3_9ASTE|nr:hypothetical protein RJ640_005903 [Escallonia rubra]
MAFQYPSPSQWSSISIDEAWSERYQLLPSDPYQRARARFWADFIDKKVWTSGHQVRSSRGAEQEAAKVEFMES